MGSSGYFAIAFLAVGGGALGFIIGLAAKIFTVKTDPRIEEVIEMLPGANCGGCGKAGCADFAKAVVTGEASPGGCPVCSADSVAAIAQFLGVDAGGGEKQVAVVLCGGNESNTKGGTHYNGVKDCISASLIAGGPKGCKYGCLGYASCANACPFGAIEMIDGLAFVHNDICVGCGKCVEACPRNLIKLVPLSAEIHVYCSSPEKGPVCKKVCDVSCIGCRKCVKAAGEGEGEMQINGFLASVDYENPPKADLIEKAKCPTGCLKPSGKYPSPVKNKPETTEAA